MVSARRREIPLLGTWHCVLPIDAHDHPAPGAVALRVARCVANCVLARELVGNLTVDARQLADLCRKKRPPASLLRQLAEHELGFLDSFVAGGARLGRS